MKKRNRKEGAGAHRGPVVLPKKEDSPRTDKHAQTMPVDETKGEVNLVEFMVHLIGWEQVSEEEEEEVEEEEIMRWVLFE